MSGEIITVEDTLNKMWESLKGPLTLDFGGARTLVAAQEMYVDGEPFFGLDGSVSQTLTA